MSNRRWRSDSFLEHLPIGQGEAHYAGRRRIVDGELTDWRKTKIVHCAAAAKMCDFLVKDDFLGAAECETLRKVFESHCDRTVKTSEGDFWNDRFILHRDLPAFSKSILLDVHKRAAKEITEFYKLSAPIYFDMMHIMSWKVGRYMPPHADNANPDGGSHGMSYRDFNGIVYLNGGSDYKGGELYFTALGIAIKPKRGMLVASTAGFHHEHAVLKVTGGNTRYTIPMFFTFDMSRAHPAALVDTL